MTIFEQLSLEILRAKRHDQDDVPGKLHHIIIEEFLFENTYPCGIMRVLTPYLVPRDTPIFFMKQIQKYYKTGK